MIREALHQFDKSCAFDQRHTAVLFAFLKHDIARRVKLSKAIRTGIGKPVDNKTIVGLLHLDLSSPLTSKGVFSPHQTGLHREFAPALTLCSA